MFLGSRYLACNLMIKSVEDRRRDGRLPLLIPSEALD